MNAIQNDSLKKITVSLLLAMAILFLLTSITSIVDNNNKIKIDRFDQIMIHRKDDTVEYYNTNNFKKSTKGDVITAEFTLPEKPGNGHYSLFSHEYNCEITISMEDEILFTYGQELTENGRETGHVFICADIPDNAWGKKITAQYKDVDYSNHLSLNPFEIYRTSEKEKYILNGSAIPYFIYVMFIAICIIILIPLIFLVRKNRYRLEGIVLMFFCLNTTLWGMGYQKMIFMTYGNSIIAGDIEYIGIFAIPASFSFFMYIISTSKFYKKIMLVISIVSSSYFIIATLLNYTTDNIHYCRTLGPVQFFIICGVIIMFFHYIRKKNLSSYQEKSIKVASSIFLIFITLDFIIYFFNFFGYINISVAFAPFGLFSFLLIIFISYLMNIVDLMMTIKEHERLQKMAYTDGMTGISNRRSCFEFLEKLDSFKGDYGIVFFDVNNLKTANDKYSHDVGDKLICCSASAISEAFDGDCFCGRYGGDEFIACITGDDGLESEIIRRLDIFKDKIKKINSHGDFPFEISIAYGYATKNDNPGKTSSEILSLADDQMYMQKNFLKKIK